MSRASNTAKRLDNEPEVDVANDTQATIETNNEIILNREKIKDGMEQKEIKTSLEKFFEQAPENLDVESLNKLRKILSDVADYKLLIPGGVRAAEEKQSILSVALEMLINNSERFERVFQTSKGSTYFQIKTGESLRLKYNQIGKIQIIDIEKISKETFFLVQEEVERERKREKEKEIKEGKGITILSYNFLLDKPLTKTDYAIGSAVFEINFDSEPTAIKAEINDNSVCFSRITNRPAMHLGHEIAKIIK